MRMLPFFAAFALAALAGSARADSFASDYDTTVDFSQLHTYAWATKPAPQLELNHARIVRAVDAQLAARAVAPAQPWTSPDVLVSYRILLDRSVHVRGTGWGGVRFARGLQTAQVEPRILATLIVEIADAATHRVIWRGIARREVDENADAEKRAKNVEKTVAKLFKRYPRQS